MALTDAQMQAMQDAKDIDTGVDNRSKKEMLAQQMSDLKTIGKVGGELAVESIPGVSEEISMKNIQDALARGDKAGAGIEAGAMALGVVPFLGDAAAKGLRKFNKTRKAYKVAVQSEDKKLYPLFVNSDKELPVGEWIEADFPKSTFKGKRTPSSEEKNYVPTKGAKRTKGEKAKGTGVSIIIPDEVTRKNLIDEGFITEKTRKTKEAPFGKVTAVAARPGLHASQKPVATHLGPQDLKVSKKEVDKLLKSGITPEAIKRRGNQYYVKRRAEDQVFVEVDMADDVDYQSMLAKEGKSDINDYVPKGGSYKYSDGQADSDQWVVGGDMKINRVLSREEARAIQNEMGVVDLPYRDEVESILGKKFVKGGVVMDDYLVAKMMNENGSKQNFAEGGMPVAKQMEMFEDGGLMDEGGSIDPVSGNDVPPGSTQEEVRDDIPAQLSEGEFVFPADVVRFIGLGNLMRIRQEAKMGLKQMDAMGQMGNSEEATMPDDLPFDLNDLDMEDDGEYKDTQEFAVGGMPNSNTGVYFNPATGPTTGVAPTPTQAASQQFVQPVRPTQTNVPTTPTYTAAEIPSFASSVGQNIPGVDFEYVEYTNQAGDVTRLRKSKSTGQLLDPVPEGYTFVDPASTTTPTVSSTAQVKPTVPYDEGQGSRDDAADDGLPAGITSTNAKAAALKALDPKFGNVIKGINDKYSSKVTNINPLVPGGLIRAAINGYKKMSETKKAINDYDYTTLETPTAQEIADGKGNSLTADEMKNVVNTIGNEIYSGYRDAEGNITAESVAKGPKSSDGLVQQMKDSFSKVTGTGDEIGEEGGLGPPVPTVYRDAEGNITTRQIGQGVPPSSRFDSPEFNTSVPITNVTENAITDIANQNQSDIAEASNPTVATTQSIQDKAGKSVSDIAEASNPTSNTQQAIEVVLNSSITTNADGVSRTTLTPEQARDIVKKIGADKLIEDDKAVKAADLARKAKQEQELQDANNEAVKATQDRYFAQQGGEGDVTQPTLADSGLDYSDPGGGQSDENPGGFTDDPVGTPNSGARADSYSGGSSYGDSDGRAKGGLISKPKPKKTKKMKKGGLASKK